MALKVLDEVRVRFADTQQFIADCIEQECLKENISVDKGFFFFTSVEAKS